MSTQTIVDECRELVDGSGSNDPIVPKRWKRAVQRSANVVWNDRPWKFKLKRNAAFSFNPALSEVELPTDFGSFETAGAGVYYSGWSLQPADIGVINIAQDGLPSQTMAVGPYTRYAIGAGSDGSPTLRLYPMPPTTTTLILIYLRRAPRCYLTADGTTDELFWIPEQWHDLISDGARWLNANDINSNQYEVEQAFVKLGLDQMRDREIQTQSLRLVGFRPGRRCR